MKRILLSMIAFVVLSMTASAQVAEPQNTPQLEFALQLKVTLDEAYTCGETQHGQRTIIPITGGTFEGPNIKGTIINGGADYQLTNKAIGRTELEAIYCIKTDDGVNIHIRNKGLIYTGKDENGNNQFYFRTAPQFEAPQDSKYAWLNNAIFVCQPSFGGNDGAICLKIWKVK